MATQKEDQTFFLDQLWLNAGQKYYGLMLVKSIAECSH